MDKTKLLNERAALHTQLTALRKDDASQISDEDWAKAEKIMADIKAIDAKLVTIEQMEEVESRNDQRIDSRSNATRLTRQQAADQDEIENDDHDDAICAYLRGHQLTQEQNSILQRNRVRDTGGARNVQSTTPDADGGFTVSERWMTQLEVAMELHAGMLEAGRIISSGDGNTWNWPTVNDTAETGRRIGENVEAGDANDIQFGNVQIGAHKYTSDVMRVSRELLQDTFVDIIGLLNEMAGLRMGRALGDDLTNGTGVGMPMGIIPAIGPNVVAAATGAGITYDDMVKLQYEVPKAYRRSGKFMMKDKTLLLLNLLKDGDGRPMWQQNIATSHASTINGKPYVENDDMADVGAGAVSVLFGDFKKYLIRRVRGFTLLRLNELYARSDQVGFIGFSRYDGQLIDAGLGPIRGLQHP